ncbi:MAG: OadG family transporter subunit [Clostridia bacterium]
MDKFVFGLAVAGIGLLVVFVGLVLLIFCIQLITKFTTASDKKKARQDETAVAPVAAQIPAPAAAPLQAEGIPADVLAAITAAIATVWQGENAFVVRHVRRISNAPAWNRAGREEQTYSRF